MQYTLPIEGLRELMLKPLLVQILTGVGKMFGHEDDLFLKIREEEPLTVVRSENGDVSYKRLYAKSSSGEKIPTYLHLSDFSMQAEGDDIYQPAMIRRYTEPIILDNELSITPSYKRSVFKLTLKYYHFDKVQLESKKDHVMLNYAISQGKFIHDVDLRYMLGRRLTTLLNETYNKRSEVLQDGADFTSYLASISSRRIQPFVNETNGAYTIGVREKHRSVVGLLETNLDSVLVEEDENTFSIEFEYSFSIEHPQGFLVKQPILYYNQLLNKNLFKFIKTQPKPDHIESTKLFTDINVVIGKNSQFYLPGTTSYVLPKIDEDVGIKRNGNYTRLFSKLVMVRGGKIQMNIRKLSNSTEFDFELKEELIDFLIKSEREYVTKYNRSMFFFTLFTNDGFNLNETLTLREDGYLVSNGALDIKKTYRVGMYVNLDLSTLDHKDKMRMKQYLMKNEVEMNHNTNLHIESLRKAYCGDLMIVNPYEIRKHHLSTLNILLLSYNIEPEVMKSLLRYGYTREDILFLANDKKMFNNISLQIYNTDLIFNKKGK